jgi:phosphoglycerate dehydrogenase-like enzyme
VTVVLVAAYTPDRAWCLPDPLLDGLRSRFGDVRFLEDRTWSGGYGPGLEEAEVLFGWHLPEPELPRAGRLRWIHSAATGVRRFTGPAFRDRGIRVSGSRGAHAPYLAEHALALLLASVRGLDRAADARAGGRWAQDEFLDAPPASLAGATVVIAGYGATGRELARLLEPFGARVIGVRRRPGGGGEGPVKVVGPAETDAALAGADAVVNLLPNTAETRGFFDGERLARLPRGARFLNLGRGSTVDETALARALADGRLAGAGLDVFAEEPLAGESPLWTTPGTTLTPHVGGMGPRLWERIVAGFADHLAAYLAGEPLPNEADEAGY